MTQALSDTCAAYGTTSATCGGASAYIRSFGNQMVISASGALNYDSYAYAVMTDVLTISGGTGTGYLNVAFSVGAFGFGGVSSPVGSTPHGMDLYGVVPFTFGVPFDYYGISAGADDSSTWSLTLTGGRVFTSMPQNCGFQYWTEGSIGLCADAGYTDISSTLATIISPDPPADVPEPGTIALTGLGLFGWGLVRRWGSTGRGADATPLQ